MLQIANNQGEQIVIVVDAAGTITGMSPAAGQVVGCSVHEALMRPLHDLLELQRGGDREPVTAAGLGSADDSRQEGPLLAIARHADGARFAVTVSPMVGAAGDRTGWVLVLEDPDAAQAAQAAVADTERRLYESVAQLEAIINALPGMVSVVDREFNMLVANRAVVEAFGHSRPDEVLGHKCYRVRKGLDDICPQCAILRTFETGQASSRVSTPAEEELMGIATKAYAIPLKNAEGEVWGGVEVIVDVTDLRAAERSIRESEERFRTLIEQAADAVYAADMQGRITIVNHRACQQTGFSREELLSRTVMDLDVRHPTLDLCLDLWTTLGPDAPKRIESRHLRRDGSSFPVEINISAIQIRGVPHVLGFVRDITARKTAESELLTFRMAVESSTNAIGIATPEGRHWYQNRRFDELFGSIEEDPVASLYVDQRLGREVFDTIINGGKWSGELQLYGRNGDILDVWLNAYSIQDASGKVVGLFGVHSDITERKRAEAERQNLERQLQQTRKLDSLGVLAGGIAHDFNNLLGGIFGNIEVALTDSSEPSVRTSLASAMRVMDRARGLTRQLLTFSKGGAPVKRVRPLFPFVRDTVEFALSGSNVSCRFEVAKGLWSCEFDEGQLAQVIDNLVINAKQAMPRGGHLRVTADNVTGPDAESEGLGGQGWVRITVEDDGIGMPSKVLPFVFDPFYTTKQVGSGLGLTTCYSIVTRHGGRIGVESTPDQGTTFTIHLPAVMGEAVRESHGAEVHHRAQGRILIMDDEEVIRRTTASMCRSFGYAVSVSSDGREALELLRDAAAEAQRFCAVIADLTVPGGMGGQDLVAEIRKTDAELPVFVSSGYADDPVMARPTEFGFTGSLCKPFRRQELAELLERHVPGTKSRPENAAPAKGGRH